MKHSLHFFLYHLPPGTTQYCMGSPTWYHSVLHGISHWKLIMKLNAAVTLILTACHSVSHA